MKDIVVYKYVLPNNLKIFTLRLPKWSEILKFGYQDGSYIIWAEHAKKFLSTLEDRNFVLLNTGEHFYHSDSEYMYYVDTCQIVLTMGGGYYVKHLYEMFMEEENEG